MWSKGKGNRRGTLQSQISESDWNGAPTEEVEQGDITSITGSSSGAEIQMNIDSIYDAIKNVEKEEDAGSKGHLFDSKLVNPDVNSYAYPRKTSIVGAPLRKLVKRSTEVSFTVPSSNSESLSAPPSNIWTKLLGGDDDLWDKGDMFAEDDDNSEYREEDRCEPVKTCSRSCYLETRHFFSTLAKYPYITAVSFFVLVLCLSAGMAAVNSERGKHIMQAQSSAAFVATDTAIWFANEFRRAMLPLYGIQQGVIHSGYFDTLKDKIGSYPQNVIQETVGTPMTKRNVTGICDDKDLQEKFRSIVEPINAENNLNGVVVSYRLFPNNVACLNEPSGESTEHFKKEDFPQGDERGSAKSTLGFDAGNSDNPFWNMVTKDLFIERKLNVFGPFTLPPLKETFCGHLSIWSELDQNNSTQNALTLQGSPVVGAWGFIMNFLDWGKLLERSDIYERFASRGFEFELYRVDGPVIEGADRATLAKSGLSHLLNPENSISIETESELHGMWANKVGVVDGWEPSWYPMAVAVVVLLSFLFAFMTASMLVERQLHRDLLYRVMPSRAIKKLQRGQTVLEKFNLVTIFFSDIVGFTNMAGNMRPLQVMAMLNELYTELDKLVEKHQIYKVETIGDAFMVVGGAPDRVPAPIAAQRVALFALDVVEFVKDFRTKNGDQIFIRAGLASGPVCAGVVGNSMPRYCFFGDTVNVASRMESTSSKMKIQVSELTYRLLQDSPDMTFDFEKRSEGGHVGVEVKGKGHQITYFVNNPQKRGMVKTTSNDIESQLESDEDESNVEIKYVPSEEIYGAFCDEDWAVIGRSNPIKATESTEVMIVRFVAILEHHLQLLVEERRPGSVLSLSVTVQLTKLVTTIAMTYGDPNFHRLSHALHVTTSLNKILSETSEFTDALDKFSLVFAAFLHDAGHTGMTNKMLQDDGHILSKKYSADVPIAERHSIEIACNTLSQPEYNALCNAIMPDDISKIIFFKALFQSILVTDIADPNRTRQCAQRFDTAYNNGNSSPDLCPLRPHLDDIITQAFKGRSDVKEAYPNEFCITIAGLQQCTRREHIMLLSDISHLFQCWENFLKWNFRLYKEIYNNFLKGLCADPSEGWYEGQIGFLEKYAIPLATRSQIFLNCGFSGKIINLANTNLALWKEHGVEASLIMADGIKEGDGESHVLEKLFGLQHLDHA